MNKKLIDKLYYIFSPYKFNPNMIYCNHCLEINDVKLLGSKPLLNLSGTELNYYITSAVLTLGDVNDYKYFLPRIIHLFINDDPSIAVNIELIGSRLAYVKWEKWTNIEIECIVNIFKDVIANFGKKYINSEDCINGIYDWISMISLCVDDISEYIEIFENSKDNIKIKYMIDLNFIVENNSKFNEYIELDNVNDKLLQWIHGYRTRIVELNDCSQIGYTEKWKYDIVKNLTTAST